MQEFTFNGDENINEKGCYMYISFNEESLNSNLFVTCSGAASVIPDGKTKYWFLYNFVHSRDWKKISKLRIRPTTYRFSKDRFKEFGMAIAFPINHFISQNN